MNKTFSTPHPVSLVVELKSGDLVVDAADTADTVVEVSGKDADEVSVEQRGEEILVLARQGGFFSSAPQLSVHVSLPQDSRLSAKLGSADVRVTGRLGACTLKSGSGDVRVDELAGDSTIETGSGDVSATVAGGALRVTCGSGDVQLDRVSGRTEVATGSGDVLVGSSSDALRVKSGSGDLRVREALDDVALSTASGDLVVERFGRGRLTAKNVSGDVAVGVPAGVPVWTDVSTTTGRVRSTLTGAGTPEPDQDFVELRATTVSGDVTLEQL
jgi:DUF4097 and DUF4098 domain-containing protein YvlB